MITGLTSSSKIGPGSGAAFVREVNDHRLDIARGLVSGVSFVHKFGSNPSIAASTTEDINVGGAIVWPTSASTVRIKAGSTNDINTTGSGARTVTVEGLDENWAAASETIACNGDSAGAPSTTTFIRVFRAYVATAGTYGGANAANVVVENSAGTADLITIQSGRGQSQTTAYTVPAGKTAYLTNYSAEVDSAKAVSMVFWQRRDADDTTAPVSAKRMVNEFLSLIGQATQELYSYPSFPAKTDLWWSGSTGAGAAAAAEADYCLVLVDD